jgi:hypothetical protein
VVDTQPVANASNTTEVSKRPMISNDDYHDMWI